MLVFFHTIILEGLKVSVDLIHPLITISTKISIAMGALSKVMQIKQTD